MSEYTVLHAGEPAPMFRGRTPSNPRYTFSSAAGRWILLGFVGSAGGETGRRMLSAVTAMRSLFDDLRLSFFGVSIDPSDESRRRVANGYPGVRWFWDFDGAISKAYGALSQEWTPEVQTVTMRPAWVLLDPTTRIAAILREAPDQDSGAALRTLLESLPDVDVFAGVPLQAPILYLPGIFEPDLCRDLIAAYEGGDAAPTGFMVERDGRTTLQHDPTHKRRKDHIVQDEALIAATRRRIQTRIAPEIRKIHQFEVTRMERFLVACYSAEDQGHFAPHRDNTTPGTAHRRFAVSINLNGDFDGGEIGFPEYGRRTFKPPTGCAVVFSCSLLHTVTPVTRGSRYAFLPFLYDEAAAKIREANMQTISMTPDTAV